MVIVVGEDEGAVVESDDDAGESIGIRFNIL